jgi:hypothetical protein
MATSHGSRLTNRVDTAMRSRRVRDITRKDAAVLSSSKLSVILLVAS